MIENKAENKSKENNLSIIKDDEAVRFIFEMIMMRRIDHEGWKVAGVDPQISIAEHSLRAAQLGFILAKMEGYSNPYEVCSMLVFHDIAECRTGDQHRIAKRYVDAREIDAVKDQTEELGETGKDILGMWCDVEDRKTEAGNIAKDADLLECAFTAKEYLEKGYEVAQDWLKNVENMIRTESAKKLFAKMRTMPSHSWWYGLKKLD